MYCVHCKRTNVNMFLLELTVFGVTGVLCRAGLVSMIVCVTYKDWCQSVSFADYNDWWQRGVYAEDRDCCLYFLFFLLGLIPQSSLACVICCSVFGPNETTSGTSDVTSVFPVIGFPMSADQCVMFNYSFCTTQTLFNPLTTIILLTRSFYFQRCVFISTFPGVIHNQEY